jgi:hypothetical protein
MKRWISRWRWPLIVIGAIVAYGVWRLLEIGAFAWVISRFFKGIF